VTRKNPLSAFKFLRLKYELHIIRLEFLMNVVLYGNQIGKKYFILEDIKNKIGYINLKI